MNVTELASFVRSRPLTTRGWFEPEGDDGPAVLQFYVPIADQNRVGMVAYEYEPGDLSHQPDLRSYSIKVTWWPATMDPLVFSEEWEHWVFKEHWFDADATVVTDGFNRVPAWELLVHFGRAEMAIRHERQSPVQIPTDDPSSRRQSLVTVEERLHGLIRRLVREQRQAEKRRQRRSSQASI